MPSDASRPRTRSTAKKTAAKKATAQKTTTTKAAARRPGERPGEQTRGARAREINAGVRYAMWSTFALTEPLGGVDRVVVANGVTRALAPLVDSGAVEIRGWYDVGGLRADADLMVWWHAEDVAQLQQAYHRLRGSALGRHLTPVWSQVALHRPAEFNKSHVPAFLAGEEPKRFISVYPFVRSYEWYLLPDEERRQMLKEHGMMARDYPDVRANTVASFSLGDYEWILAFEADELHRIVDLMRHLRGSTARRHVREETPFFTGRRLGLTELLQTLP